MPAGRGFCSTPSFTISGAPPSSPGGAPSSAGWKMNLIVPGRSAFMRGQHGGDAQLHGGVDVVAARVHHPDILTEIRRAHLRRERQAGLLGDGQRVDVRAHRHDGPGPAAFQQRDDAVARTPVCTSRPSFRR